MCMQAASSRVASARYLRDADTYSSSSCSSNIQRMQQQACLTLNAAQGSAQTSRLRGVMMSLAKYRQGGSAACLEGDDCVARGEGATGDIDHQNEPQQVVGHWATVPACSIPTSSLASQSQGLTPRPQDLTASSTPANILVQQPASSSENAQCQDAPFWHTPMEHKLRWASAACINKCMATIARARQMPVLRCAVPRITEAHEMPDL